MLHASNNDAILNELLHGIISSHPTEGFASATKRHIERTLYDERGGIDVSNRIY